METLGGILVVLGLALFVLGIVGGIAPRLLRDRKTGEVPKRLHVLLGGIVAGMVATAVGGAMLPTPEPDAADKTVAAAPEPKPAVAPAKAAEPVAVAQPDPVADAPKEATPPEPKTKPPEKTELAIGISVDTWKKDMNKAFKAVDLPALAAKETKCNDDGKCAQNFFMGKIVSFVVNFGQADRAIRDIMFLSTGDGTPKSGLDQMLAYQAMAQVLTPDIPKTERGRDVMGLFEGALADSPAKDNHAVIGEFKFSLDKVEGFGLLGGVSRDH